MENSETENSLDSNSSADFYDDSSLEMGNDCHKFQNSTSKKLGTEKIPRLLARMAIPAILSMLVQATYNLIDSIFISHYSIKALEALSIVFAMQMLVGAFAVGLGVAANSCISRYLGEGKKKEASDIAKTCLILALMLSVLFAVLSVLFSEPYLKIYTSDYETIKMGKIYLMTVSCFSFGVFFELLANKILQATGNMIIPMITQLSGALINIALDPIMIFGLFGFPEMGVAGSAIATVIGQIVAMIIGMSILIFSKSSHEISLAFKGFRLKLQNLKNIASVGVPVSLMNALASVTITLLNIVVINFNAYGILILGIYFKLQTLVFMPVFGLNQGAMPIMGYNYGANNKKRFVETYRLALFVGLGMTFLGFLTFQLFPDLIASMFGASDELKQEAVYAFRLISISFLPAGVCITAVGLFNAIGHGFKALLLNLSRQIFLVLPLMLLLGVVFGSHAIWLNFGIAEIIVAAIFFPLALRTIKKIFDDKGLVLEKEQPSVNPD